MLCENGGYFIWNLQNEYQVGPLVGVRPLPPLLPLLYLISTCGKYSLFSRSSSSAQESERCSMLVLQCVMCSLVYLALQNVLGEVDAHSVDKMNKEM